MGQPLGTVAVVMPLFRTISFLEVPSRIDREQFARSALTTVTHQSDYNIYQDLVLGVSGLENEHYREEDNLGVWEAIARLEHRSGAKAHHPWK